MHNFIDINDVYGATTGKKRLLLRNVCVSIFT